MALSDAQVDAIFASDIKANGCCWLEGSAWPYVRCGGQVLAGKHYCKAHFDRAYIKNSALRNKRKAKYIEAEVREAELAQLVAEQDADHIDVTEPVAVEDFG